jgi:acetylornithine deacetylase
MSDPTNELESLLSRLVSIDSVNPSLVPGARGEAEIGGFVAEWLRARGLEVQMQETDAPGRQNVIAVARGTGGGRSLLLNAHMDTVGVAGMTSPFQPVTRDGKLFGRGAQDTKAALAAFMRAAAEAPRLHLRGDVILTAVVDEEYASAGTEAVARGLKADAAIVGEPSGLQIVTEHKGFAWFRVQTAGVAAHGSLPDVGVDAILKMGKVLAALDELSVRLRASTPHHSLGTGSLHASLITGGQELSSYPAACVLDVERRTIPGETADLAESQVRSALDAIAAADPAFKATLQRTFARNPMEARRDSAVVKALAEQVRRVTGAPPVFSGMSGWLDSALLDGAGIPTVVLGPSGAGLHGVEEWVDLQSVRACSDIALGTIADFCR